jgi:hypothetical protein
MRVAVELREILDYLLQVGPADNPAIVRLIASYHDIARELGQQGEVERVLRDVLPWPVLASVGDLYAGSPLFSAPSVSPTASASHSSRNTSPSQTSWNAPSR